MSQNAGCPIGYLDTLSHRLRQAPKQSPEMLQPRIDTHTGNDADWLLAASLSATRVCAATVLQSAYNTWIRLC
jgi:hypothetical protein